VTHRSPLAILEHARRTLGRRRFRQFWARIGRRGRKSSTSALMAVYEALYGGHERHVMPGEQALVAVVSKDLAGANVITRFVRIYLDALGFKHSTARLGAVQIIEIEGCQIGIATLAAATDAPRGFALPVLIYDEIAHAATSDDYVDNDRAMLAAAEPAQAQFSEPLIVGISTGLGRDGVHYERIERALGNDAEESILAVTGASWDWSGDIDEARAAEICGNDADMIEREFRGGVSDNESTAFVRDHVAGCYGDHLGRYFWQRPSMWIDVGERVDSFAWAVGCWGEPDPSPHYKRLVPPADTGLLPDTFIGYELDEYGSRIPLPKAERPLLWIYRVGGWAGREVADLGMDRVTAELAAIATGENCQVICGDQRGAPFLQALLTKHARSPATFKSVTWTQETKHESVNLLRAWMRDKQLALCEHAEMRAQLTRYKRRIVGGGFKYGVPNQADDYAAVMLTCAMHHLVESGANATETRAPVEGAPTARFRGGRSLTSGR
jgi:hypothetical protein